MSDFLDLPGEIKNEIYSHYIPTADDPWIFNYDTSRSPLEQPVYALCRACKATYLELLYITDLLSDGAIIPSLQITDTDIGDDFLAWEARCHGLIPFVKHASILRIESPSLSPLKTSEADQITVSENGLKAWTNFLDDCPFSNAYVKMMDAFLSSWCKGPTKKEPKLVLVVDTAEAHRHGVLEWVFTTIDLASLRNLGSIEVVDRNSSQMLSACSTELNRHFRYLIEWHEFFLSPA